MHDVLAHRISQVSLHAGALTYRDDLTADEMRESAAVIQAQANEALHELRGVLGVLRDTETGELLDGPQPTYDDLAALVDAARRARDARRVHHRPARGRGGAGDGRADRLPDRPGGPDQRGQARARAARCWSGSAAPRTTASTSWSATRSGSRAAARPGPGSGLVGLAERAELRGGRLEHRADGSTFVLHGWIPWAA